MKPIFPISSLAILLAAPVLHAQLISQDSFSAYSVGNELPGLDPTISGYTGPWTDVAFGDAEPAVMAGSLAYGDATYVAGIGNHVGKAADATGIGPTTSGRVERLLDSALAVDDTTTGTVYLSFLFQTGNEGTAANPDTYQTLALWNGTGATDSLRDFELGIGNPDFSTANYAFRVDNTTAADLGVTRDANVHLFVVKFELSDTSLSDAVTVWMDPTLGAGEPTGGVTLSGSDLAFDRLVLSDYASNSCAWDEIRWGSTFDSVTTESFLPAIPTFEGPPADYVGFVGDTMVLSAFAPADPEPSYQWEYSVDGEEPWSEVAGATSAVLEIPNVPFSANGYYRVTATNGNGTDTSGAALVDLIYPDPTITQQPSSVFAEAGSTVELSVQATGLGTLTYQWFKNFEELPGETAATLTLSDLGMDDAGDYFVEVTDDAAEADGEPATFIDSALVSVAIVEPWDGLVSHEPFDTTAGYVLGELATQNPTIDGYIDPWTITNGFGPISPVVSSGSLVYPDPFYLGASGDSVSTPADTEDINATNAGRVGRLLEAQLVVNDATTGTRYLSWLFRSGFENAAPNPQVYQTLALFNGVIGTDGNRDFEAGIAVGAADFNTTNFAYKLNNNTSLVGDLGVPSDGSVHLFVAKIELSDVAGGDSVTVWIDPTLGSGDPAGGVTVSGADLLWDRIALSDYASDSSRWDEIRWGSTFDSVTLNPSPSNNYAAWIGLYPGVGGQTGFEDDPDGDGLANGLENFLGTDPSVANTGIVEVSAAAGSLTFEHPQNATPADDVSAAYRWSLDLAGWNADGATSGGTTVNFAGSPDTPVNGTTTVTATISGTQPDKLFVELEATQNP